MKKYYLFFFFLLTLIGCNKSGSVDSTQAGLKDSASLIAGKGDVDKGAYIFKEEKDRADTLVKYVELAMSSKDKSNYDRLIFNSFPDSFDGMFKLFGFDKEMGGAPLYKWPDGENVIKYFGGIQSIPKAEYYGKYINICINGYWDADNIKTAFGFHKRLSEDTKSVCQVLSKRTDDEVMSVFRFIFDSPHPKNEENAMIYKDLQAKLKLEDTHMADLLKTAYEKVLSTDDGHGK